MIMLRWNPPTRPNGIIIYYEVSYIVSGNRSVIEITNTSTNFSIQPLLPETIVFNISVSAYTSIGRSISANIFSLSTLSPVTPRKCYYRTYKLVSLNILINLLSGVHIIDKLNFITYPKL